VQEMRILLIEDNPGDVRLVQEILREAGSDFTIGVAENLGLGLKFLLSQEFDVVLLDLGLPDSRGLETLTKVRTQFPSLPVVIMTGSGDEALGVQAVQLGAQDYLVKGQIDSGLLRRALLYAIERKKADEALRHSKEQWELTFNTVPDLIAILDKQHRILRVNRAMADRLGVTPDHCIGLRCYEAVHGIPEIPRFCPHFLTCQDGQQHVAEVSEPRLGGDFLVSTTPLCDPRGQIIGAVHVARDITERKAAEQKLRQRTVELQKLTETLEQRVTKRTAELARANELLEKDIAERKHAEEQLRESEKKLRYLSTELMTAQEKERKRIAGELHDSIAASLSAIKFGIENILSQMEQDEWCQRLRDVVSRVQQVTEETRRIMSDLRPSMLDDLGIVPAINWFCREFQKTYSNVSVEKKIDIEESAVPDSLRTPIFRICQEALNNVAKHSKATLVNLSLQKLDNRIELSIEDNGEGFNSEGNSGAEHSRKGLGLVSMRERAEFSGGFFNIESTMGKGTVICVWWP